MRGRLHVRGRLLIEPAAPRATDPEVVRALVENHARFLAFLERRVGSREDAEAILQSAFVRGLERGAALRDQESATAAGWPSPSPARPPRPIELWRASDV